MWYTVITIVAFVTSSTFADVYLHNPRGSNNRLDERGRERANANRMFDSQNNNRGGYNVGSLYYYPGSVLPIEWTNQHSCGEKNNHCELILQYMCSPHLRDGTKTTTIPLDDKNCANYDCNTDLEYGMQEDHEHYLHCRYRKRNTGLFTADQKMRNRNTAINTRQNPKGTRRGYECPEERDYYPYWGPSPWKDIAIMTNDVNRCAEYQQESQNTKAKWTCKPPTGFLRARLRNKVRNLLPNNKKECELIRYNNQNATWTAVPPHGVNAPECIQSPKSRDNHNGNGLGGFTNKYNWEIPNDVNGNCALRLRYNISTGDYDGWNATVKDNQKVDIASLVGLPAAEAAQRGYTFKGNPVVQPLKKTIGNVNVGAKLKLRLAVNTAQFGRVFQDRSHSFEIRARPKTMDKNIRIKNLNVRGKRGNIVQVYPAVEYDFVPNRLDMNVNEYIHIQWTGSNTNPDNNDGQGLRGTDRSNVVLLRPEAYREGKLNAPIPENQKNGHFGRNYPEHLNIAKFLGLPKSDLLKLAVLPNGQYKGELSELDDAGTYFDLGARKITSSGAGTYHYMCTRNNNFSNRGQKGRIVVNAVPKVQALMGWSGGKVTMADGIDGVWVDKGVLSTSATIKITKMEADTGEATVKEEGGYLSEGTGYESDYFVVEPFDNIAGNGKSVTIKMKVDSSSAIIYHTTDYKTWREVRDVDYDDNVATFQSQKGGVFVARGNNTKRNVIIGVVVAILVAAVLILGTTVYCRRHPSKWEHAKRNMNDIRLGTKSQI